MFGLNLDQLKTLMALRRKELMDKLSSTEYGGVRGVLEKLKVDENQGLSSNDRQDLLNRQRAYGKNEYLHRSVSFFSSPL